MAGGTINTENLTIGGAKLYFCSTIADRKCLPLGNASIQTTTYSLGNIVTSEITPEVTYVDHFTSSNGKRVKDKTAAVTSMIRVGFTFDEMNPSNLSKFFMGNLVGSDIQVLQNTLDEGCANLVVKTDIGQDLTYVIPKCAIRPDGALNLADEAWHQAGMVLECLEYQSGNQSNATVNATFLISPFGRISVMDL